MPNIQAEVKPLTQEDMERYWHEVGDELDIAELLKDASVKLGEQHGIIEIDALTTYFHEDFKPHRMDVLEALRRKSGMKMLDCKVNQLFVDKDELVYSPDEKYKAMVQCNPAMQHMRHLFPSIDF